MKDLIYNNVIERFYEVVAKNPDDTIAVWNSQLYTYHEINKFSNRVARVLKENGIEKGSGVGIYSGRNVYFLIAVLGILKAGCYYIPLSEEENPKKILYCLEDSQVNCICMCEPDNKKIFGEKYKQINIANYLIEESIDILEENPKGILYRMYTSGTTGLPKGCSITHGNLFNFILHQNFMQFSDKVTMLQVGAPAFDACTYEIWRTILWAGKIVFLSKQELLDVEILKKTIKQFAITDMLLTPSLFNQLSEVDVKFCENIKCLLVGGSSLSVKHIKQVWEQNKNLRIFNAYGPTENTVVTTIHEIQEADLERERIPIGKALVNVKLLLVDEKNNPVQQGECGELCIGGESLCLGYHEREELMKEKFFYHNGERYYKSGDIVREFSAGMYDFIDRVDNQIKLNGFRVELSEIEIGVKEIKGVQDVAILAEKHNQSFLVSAYYTSGVQLNKDYLKEEATKMLATYMIPNKWINVKEMPLTSNGKVDAKKLESIAKEIDDIVKKLKEIFETHNIQIDEKTKIKELLNHTNVLASIKDEFVHFPKEVLSIDDIYSIAEKIQKMSIKNNSHIDEEGLIEDILEELKNE